MANIVCVKLENESPILEDGFPIGTANGQIWGLLRETPRILHTDM